MNVSLRPATDSDLVLIMAWRSNPILFDFCYTQKEPLTWAEHYNWWHSRGPWWRFFIIQLEEETGIRDVGLVNFGQLDNWNPEFNFYLGEVSLWGQGVGEKALSLGLEWLKERGYCRVHTTVKETNDRSKGVLGKIGFVRTIPARKGEWYWEIQLSDEDRAAEYTSGRKLLDVVSTLLLES